MKIEKAELHTATSIIFGVRTKLTFQEFCQILAALRHWQRTYERTAPAIIKADWDEHFEDCEPMTMQQIDELCERITFA